MAPARYRRWPTSEGDLLGFDAAYQIKSAFKSYTADGTGDITTLRTFGEESGLLPTDKTLVFAQNHDTERDGSTLNYQDGATNLLANQFLLAYDYGRPQVYSAFEFSTRDDSPPSDADGLITDTTCGNGWACVDRAQGVANMVQWHNQVGDSRIRNWYDDSMNLIAFSRGHRGWIAINNSRTPVTHRFSTGMAAGTYCDIIHGDAPRGTCTDPPSGSTPSAEPRWPSRRRTRSPSTDTASSGPDTPQSSRTATSHRTGHLVI